MIFALYLLSVNFISDLFLSFSRVLFPTLNFYKYLIYALSRINLPICMNEKWGYEVKNDYFFGTLK